MSEETTTETGAEATAVAAAPVSIDPDFREQAVEALKNVSDPELGVNIVDLGLIYDLAYDEENDALVISMTLTSAGCPLTDVIENDIAESLDGLVAAFRINWVWMPPWTPARITDDGREMMRPWASTSDSRLRERVSPDLYGSDGTRFLRPGTATTQVSPSEMRRYRLG